MERQVGIPNADDREAFNLQLLEGKGWDMWDRWKPRGHGVCISVVDGRTYFYT